MSDSKSLRGDGENLAARVQEAKRLLAEDSENAMIAWLLGIPAEDVERVSGA